VAITEGGDGSKPGPRHTGVDDHLTGEKGAESQPAPCLTELGRGLVVASALPLRLGLAWAARRRQQHQNGDQDRQQLVLTALRGELHLNENCRDARRHRDRTQARRLSRRLLVCL
jgi:hypothetical protein